MVEMRVALSAFFFIVMLLSVFLVGPQNDSFSQVDEESKEISKPSPIVIHSDSLEVDQQKRVVVFDGGVRAKTEDMMIDCRKMLVYYRGSPAKNESPFDSSKIDKIVALGNVTVHRSDGSIARAGEAVYYQGEEKIVLTENPSVQQGRDVVEGHRIIILLNENRSIVEGSETKRVKATLFPKEEKGRE
jgi:lipopolysaccharide export system protein LptA